MTRRRTSTSRTAVAAACLLTASLSLRAAGGDDARYAAFIGLARVKRDAGHPDDARHYFEAARHVHPLQIGELAEYFWVLSSVDPVDAMVTGREVLRARPRADDIRDRMIAGAAARHDEVAVVALAREGARLDASNARWPRRLGQSLLRQDRPAEAAAAFRVATRSRGADARDWAELAVALEAAHRPAAALKTWASVPPSIQAERPEWAASRLRALAQATPAPTAAPALERWLAAHPTDDSMRAELVEAWTRGHRPDLALDALRPLLAGASAARWTPSAIDLAKAAGAPPTLAIQALSARANAGLATTDELWTLADLFIDADDVARAEATVSRASVVDPCGDRAFAVLDRLPDPVGTDAMVRAMRHRDCQASSHWARRTIDRAVALGRHADALAIVQTLPSADANAPDLQPLRGKLLLWTGQPALAVQILEPVVRAGLADVDTRLTLVNALRAIGRTHDAWTTAQPLLEIPISDRADQSVALSLADLALEAGYPERVGALLSRISSSAATTSAVRERTGRASLMLGRNDDAIRMLAGLDRSSLSAPAALALIDATAATRGRAAALTIAASFTKETSEWREVLARRVMLESLAGHADIAARLSESLAHVDPALALIAAAETSLAMRRPLDALAALDRIGASGEPDRVADLRATALEGAGEFGRAASILADLSAARPESASYASRLAVARWRAQPGPQTRQAVIALTTRWPDSIDARIAAASAFADDHAFAEALSTLGDPGAWTTLPIAGRVLAARSLQQLGRPVDALALIDALPDLDSADALLRAQLIGTVHGPEAAAAAFLAASHEPTVQPALFLAWSAAAQSADERRAILTDGAGRFPLNASVLAALATAEWQDGLRDDARQTATRAVAIDADSGDAWVVLIDAAAASPSSNPTLHAVLDAFGAQTANNTALAIGMAEHMSGLATVDSTLLLTTSMGWLDAVPPTDPLAGARDLARVHVWASAARWPRAVAAVDAILQRDPRSLAALRLRAAVLSWAGRDDEALQAYAGYLARVPDDIDARRQQARVAGWAGRASLAGQLYGDLRRAHPDIPAISAEADAKNAFLAGRWREAAGAYRQWLTLDPSNSEARFELAESLRASGNTTEADRTLANLAATGDRLAADAAARDRLLRQPAISALGDSRNADGYGGQRLLDFQQRGAALAMTFGADGRTGLTVAGARLEASGGDTTRDGSRVSGEVTTRVSTSLGLDGALQAWAIDGHAMPLWDVHASWQATDRWRYIAGVNREWVLDSMTTVDQHLSASGTFVGASGETPSMSIDARTSWQRLSDGNAREQATLSVTHAVAERARRLRVVIWGQSLSYRAPAAVYFSPDLFLRLDGGVEYTHPFNAMRFRGDRENTFTAGYLVGTDTHGTLYQHPTARFSFEFARGVAVDASGSWIRSVSYHETAVSIGVRVIAGPFASK